MKLNQLLYDPESFGITKYQWRADGKLDVFQDIDLSKQGLNSLPFNFGQVKGNFTAYKNKLDEHSIPDLPESCSMLYLVENNFKNLNEFHTKTEKLILVDNPLESIEGIKNLSFDFVNFFGCSKIKDWENVPFANCLDLFNSNVNELVFSKHKKLKQLNIMNTNIENLEGVSVELILTERSKIKSLKNLAKCPIDLYCDKEKEEQFINELKEMFPSESFKLKQINNKKARLK